MSFDAPVTRPQRIAVIGAGISGLAAAYELAAEHNVTVYEAEKRLGGHARTVTAGRRGDQPVDTGFIVFNYANYPHLTRMFHELNVPVKKSDMSFGATIDEGAVEYGLRDLRAVFAQPGNLARPAFLRMVRDILRFNVEAEAAAAAGDLTIGDLVDHLGLGTWFQRYYLMPICGAIWSTPPSAIRAFPARALLSFFRNHALLSATGQHQWWTVDGGSVEYVRRLTDHLKTRGVALRPGTPVKVVERRAGTVTIHAESATPEFFDQVIFATHSDDSLRLLAQPTEAERAALSAVAYQDNRVILHRDAAQMPKRKGAWSSWVYKAEGAGDETKIGVSYWMNRLQGIPDDDPMFITLNPVGKIPEALTYDEVTFRHPVFDAAALAAQDRIAGIQGENNTWFAGAWLRHGFHEDGFASAVRVARAIAPRRALLAA
jgi:uncharacterized protein